MTDRVFLLGLDQLYRLRAVTSSRLYGLPRQDDRLLPAPRDAVSTALHVAAAHRAAVEWDDISLVGLAARAQDAVVLAAVRESEVLYAELVFGAAGDQPRPRYVWRVDSALARQGSRFVSTFNALFEENLPTPQAAHAQAFWNAAEDNEVVGRCVGLGIDPSGEPAGHYHWGFCRRNDGTPVVRDFWSAEVWTSSRYRATLRGAGYCPRSGEGAS